MYFYFSESAGLNFKFRTPFLTVALLWLRNESEPEAASPNLALQINRLLLYLVCLLLDKEEYNDFILYIQWGNVKPLSPQLSNNVIIVCFCWMLRFCTFQACFFFFLTKGLKGEGVEIQNFFLTHNSLKHPWCVCSSVCRQCTWNKAWCLNWVQSCSVMCWLWKSIMLHCVMSPPKKTTRMSLIWLFTTLSGFASCREQIYIAPSGVQKERIQVSVKLCFMMTHIWLRALI